MFCLIRMEGTRARGQITPGTLPRNGTEGGLHPNECSALELNGAPYQGTTSGGRSPQQAVACNAAPTPFINYWYPTRRFKRESHALSSRWRVPTLKRCETKSVTALLNAVEASGNLITSNNLILLDLSGCEICRNQKLMSQLRNSNLDLNLITGSVSIKFVSPRPQLKVKK